MRTVLLSLLILFLSVTARPQAPSLAGNWLATLETSGIKLRFVLKVEKSADGYTAKFDSPDQGAKDLSIDSIKLDGNKVTFAAAAYGITYEGTVNEKFDEINGTLRQGASVPMIFKRVDVAPTLNRPQDPAKPYPYDEEEVSYRNATDNIKLGGTLTLPRDKSKRYPVALLITGSGSQDRNETIAGHRPFLVLADHLTRNGIAVLRVDDRGVGGTDRGDSNATSENFVYDVLAGVEYLKTRKEIDPKQIGLIGHSEGGMIAPMVAAKSKDVAFIVMMAGLGQRGDDVIYSQTELIQRISGIDQETNTSTLALLKKINTIAVAETDSKQAEAKIKTAIDQHVASMSEARRKAFAPVEESIKTRLALYTSPWYRYFISFDPAVVLAKVKVPVLALNGERDLQVPYEANLNGIASGLKAAKNNDVTVRSIPHLNHLFQSSMTGLPSEYQTIEETISPAVLKIISDWITSHTRR